MDDIRTYAVQSLNDMLEGYREHYPYEVKFSEVQWDPVLILHSSGSTDNDMLNSKTTGGLT